MMNIESKIQDICLESINNFDYANIRHRFGGNRFVLVSPYDEPPMIPEESHHNVTKIQLERGGNSVLGLRLEYRNPTMVGFCHHSVWQMPDRFGYGRLVEVTLDKPSVFLPLEYFDARDIGFAMNRRVAIIHGDATDERSIILVSRKGGHTKELGISWLKKPDFAKIFRLPVSVAAANSTEYQEYLTKHYSSQCEAA